MGEHDGVHAFQFGGPLRNKLIMGILISLAQPVDRPVDKNSREGCAAIQVARDRRTAR